jgi:hypothetical protein
LRRLAVILLKGRYSNRSISYNRRECLKDEVADEANLTAITARIDRRAGSSRAVAVP